MDVSSEGKGLSIEWGSGGRVPAPQVIVSHTERFEKVVCSRVYIGSERATVEGAVRATGAGDGQAPVAGGPDAAGLGGWTVRLTGGPLPLGRAWGGGRKVGGRMPVR